GVLLAEDTLSALFKSPPVEHSGQLIVVSFRTQIIHHISDGSSKDRDREPRTQHSNRKMKCLPEKSLPKRSFPSRRSEPKCQYRAGKELNAENEQHPEQNAIHSSSARKLCQPKSCGKQDRAEAEIL